MICTAFPNTSNFVSSLNYISMCWPLMEKKKEKQNIILVNSIS
jgi:hypothetical protein